MIIGACSLPFDNNHHIHNNPSNLQSKSKLQVQYHKKQIPFRTIKATDKRLTSLMLTMGLSIVDVDVTHFIYDVNKIA